MTYTERTAKRKRKTKKDWPVFMCGHCRKVKHINQQFGWRFPTPICKKCLQAVIAAMPEVA